MKIFAMNNNVFHEKDGGLYVYGETGNFFMELKELGNEVRLFQISERTSDTEFENFNLCGRGLKISSVSRRNSRLLSFVRAFFKGIAEVFKADFVYVFYPGPICAFVALVAFISGKNYGLYVRGEQGIANWISKLLYRNAEIVLTISPRFTDEIRNIGATSFTIRPMIGFHEREIEQNRQYFNKNIYKLLFVGRVVRDKGIFEMIHGLSQLLNSGQENWSLDIIGDGPDLKELKQDVDRLFLNSQVNFRGNITDKNLIKRFYMEADLFILPSHHEGFPRVLYEAMIFGVPIITTFVGTISTLMIDEVNCYKIAINDQEDLAYKVGTVLSDYSKKASVAVEATKTVTDYFSNKEDSHAVQLHKFLHLGEKESLVITQR